MNFSFQETRDIIKLAPVHVEMKNVIIGQLNREKNPIKPTPPWHYVGRDIPTGPFRLFRGCVVMAVERAVAATIGRERERLLSMLRMVDGDPVEPVAKALGIACEEYAVTMQYGADGWRSYQQFIQPYEV